MPQNTFAIKRSEKSNLVRVIEQRHLQPTALCTLGSSRSDSRTLQIVDIKLDELREMRESEQITFLP